ncbi:MAG: helix-turn-helix transcriptional regulator [Nanoarchaeota archaeon]|nr:helix-turn-helix transcriptional regulator [Nanoarchaeota archaeon]
MIRDEQLDADDKHLVEDFYEQRSSNDSGRVTNMSKQVYKARMELSKDIIEYIHDTFRDNYRQIGQKIGLSRSLISQIHNSKRDLTLENLLKIERAYEIPLSEILLKVTKDKNIPEKLKPRYKTARRILDLLESDPSLLEVFQREM